MFLFACVVGREGLELAQELRRQHGSRPGPEVLRAEILPGDFLEVGVHLVRTDRLPFTVLVVVLKQLVAGKIAALFDDAREAPVVQIDFVLDTALAAEREPHALSLELDVRVAQRRQAVRAIRSRVFVVADANQRLFEQLHDRREHLLARQTLASHVLAGPPADGRQCLREPDHAVVFRFVADLAPLRVIAILFAAARVAPGRLKVSARIGQIQTPVHAGGMTSALIRASSDRERMARPSASV